MVELSCIVLAGGLSSRVGNDKRMLRIKGKTFFESALEKAREISSDVIVSLGDEGQVKKTIDGVTLVFDEEKKRGPLFALTSSLKHCKKQLTILMPVDAPLLNPEIYKTMVDKIERDPSIEAVVPKVFSGPEPLFGVYQTTPFLSGCTMAIKRGDESVMDAINLLSSVNFIEMGEFKDIDPKFLSFQNVNTPFDLERLMEKIDG
jgi:molybdopterin-guanine dinucleotide biosynthesis protein A